MCACASTIGRSTIEIIPRYWSSSRARELSSQRNCDPAYASQTVYFAVQPPSMTSADPVTKAASSEAR